MCFLNLFYANVTQRCIFCGNVFPLKLLKFLLSYADTVFSGVQNKIVKCLEITLNSVISSSAAEREIQQQHEQEEQEPEQERGKNNNDDDDDK